MRAQVVLRGRTAVEFWQQTRLFEARENTRRDAALLTGGAAFERGSEARGVSGALRATDVLSNWRESVPTDHQARICTNAATELARCFGLGFPLMRHAGQIGNRRKNNLVESTRKTITGLSVIHVRDGVYVLSPESTLIDVSCDYELTDFLVLACGFASKFCIDPKANALLEAPAIMTTDSFTTAVIGNDYLHGIKQARQVASLLVEGSRSPMETTLGLVLSLPYKMGGYGLPKPVLNQTISLEKHPANQAKVQSIECDLLWPKDKIALFYDSNSEHLRPHQMANDARRNNALNENGVRTIEITHEQFKSMPYMDHMASALARMMHVRIRPRRDDYYARKVRLRNLLRNASW